MAGLLGQPRGLLSPRQVRQPGAPGGQPSPLMGMGMPMMGGQGGGDPRDAPGTSVSIWRELMRGLSQQGIGALGTSNAGSVFSPANRAMLAPAYQKKGGGK